MYDLQPQMHVKDDNTVHLLHTVAIGRVYLAVHIMQYSQPLCSKACKCASATAQLAVRVCI